MIDQNLPLFSGFGGHLTSNGNECGFLQKWTIHLSYRFHLFMPFMIHTIHIEVFNIQRWPMTNDFEKWQYHALENIEFRELQNVRAFVLWIQWMESYWTFPMLTASVEANYVDSYNHLEINKLPMIVWSIRYPRNAFIFMLDKALLLKTKN